MSDAALPDPAAPRSPVRWLVVGVLIAALIVIAASIYARVEVRRLRDEQVALTERHRLDTLQLIRIDNNVATIEDTLRDMTDRSEPYPLSAWQQAFERLRVDLDQALTRERALAPVARPATQTRQLDEASRRLWEAVDRGFAAARTGRDEEAHSDLHDRGDVASGRAHASGVAAADRQHARRRRGHRPRTRRV